MPETRRVFIGIEADEHTVARCVELQRDLMSLPAQLIRPEDMHLTLIPPWNMSDQDEVEGKMERALQDVRPFKVVFDQFTYGPDDLAPRYAWAISKPSIEILTVRRKLFAFFEPDRRPLFPHITLARFAEKDMNLLRRNPVKSPLDFAMSVVAVTLFASPLPGEIGYTVLYRKSLLVGAH